MAGRDGGPATAVRLRAGHDTVRLEVDGDAAAVSASAPLWAARGRALGADLTLPGPTSGRVVLRVPVPPLSDPSSDEPRRSP
jgi:hypothetical protein